MLHRADQLVPVRAEPFRAAHTPVWRRVTALFTLSSVVILIAVVVAVVVAASALLALFVLERAIAG
jgi:hypothetical protein